MEIKIGYGIGDAVFGMRRGDILSLIGEPDVRRLLDEYDDDPREEWDYNEQKLTLRFYDAEGGRLAWIESENKNLTLFQKPVIGINENDVIDLMKASGFDDYEYEEYDSFKIFDYKDNWIEFESVYERISRVKIGALIDENDDYVWQYKF